MAKDQEARNWREANSREVTEQLKPFLDKIYRRSKSQKAVDAKQVALLNFCSWQRKLPKQIIREITTRKSNPYTLLDEFISYLSKFDFAPHTMKNYLSGAKRWLKFSGIELNDQKLKETVELPRQYPVTKDRVPTNEELSRIVYSTDARGKALVTLLSSSGMRIGEALSLQIADVNFEVVPTKIHLRPEITKDRQERTCFISQEATGFLKDYLKGGRLDQKMSYVFQGRHQGVRPDGRKFTRGEWENRPMSYWNADAIFSTALRKAGLEEKDENNRDKITIHSLRRFFFTRLVAALGRETTEALMGHKEFLDASYRRFTLDELGEQYKKAEEEISIRKGRSEDSEISKILRTLVNVGVLDIYRDDKTRTVLSELFGIRSSDPNFSRLLLEKLGIKHAEIFEQDKSDPKVIGESELEAYLAKGWDVQTVLPSGRIIIKH